MTTKEAIAFMRNIRCDYWNPAVRAAIDIAIAALREKADKERRYVVMGLPNIDKPFIVKDNQMEDGRSNWVATDIPTREAAQSIADIYEGVKQ